MRRECRSTGINEEMRKERIMLLGMQALMNDVLDPVRDPLSLKFLFLCVLIN